MLQQSRLKTGIGLKPTRHFTTTQQWWIWRPAGGGGVSSWCLGWGGVGWGGVLFHKRIADRKTLLLWISVLERGTRSLVFYGHGYGFEWSWEFPLWVWCQTDRLQTCTGTLKVKKPRVQVYYNTRVKGFTLHGETAFEVIRKTDLKQRNKLRK